MDKFLERVKSTFARITGSDKVQKSVSTAKETAAGVGATASKVAGDAAGKARVTAANLGDKARETASDLSEKTAQLADSAALRTRETASDLSDKTAQLADSAAEKAKETASDLSGKTAQLADAAALKARETADGLSSPGDQTAPQAVASDEGQAVPEVSGDLSESARVTDDESRDQADAFVREAAVELDTAPADVPGDAVEVEPDPEVGAPGSGVEVDDAVRQSKTDTHQE